MKKIHLKKIIKRIIREHQFTADSFLNERPKGRIKICVASGEGINSTNCLNRSCGGLGGGCGEGCRCSELIDTGMASIDPKDTGMLNERPKVGRCRRISSPTPLEYYHEICGGPCYKGRPCAGSGCDCWS